MGFRLIPLPNSCRYRNHRWFMTGHASFYRRSIVVVDSLFWRILGPAWLGLMIKWLAGFIQKPLLQHTRVLVNLVLTARKFGVSFRTALKFPFWQDSALMVPRPIWALLVKGSQMARSCLGWLQNTHHLWQHRWLHWLVNLPLVSANFWRCLNGAACSLYMFSGLSCNPVLKMVVAYRVQHCMLARQVAQSLISCANPSFRDSVSQETAWRFLHIYNRDHVTHRWMSQNCHHTLMTLFICWV